MPLMPVRYVTWPSCEPGPEASQVHIHSPTNQARRLSEKNTQMQMQARPRYTCGEAKEHGGEANIRCLLPIDE